MKKGCLTSLAVILMSRLLFAQEIPLAPATDTKPAAEEKDGSSTYVIFSNLGSPGDLYNDNAFDALPIFGSNVKGEPEASQAVHFVPKYDVQVTTLEAAIGYSSGTRIVNLALYTNDPTFGYPSTAIASGGADVTDIPDAGDCCQLIKVTLPGNGVNLSAGTDYWMVGQTDDSKGADFAGGWQVSHSGESAYLEPPAPWAPERGEWPAARIRGHRLKRSERGAAPAATETSGSSNKVTFFINFDPTSSYAYFAGTGLLITGKDSNGGGDVTEALPFTARADGYAKTVSAAIGYYEGADKGIILSLYSDDEGLPGKPLPKASGSTSDFPDAGQCCEFATVKLPGKGVKLEKGGKYWLVAGPDDVNAPAFEGIWQLSTLAEGSEAVAGNGGWHNYAGQWAAAQITGTSK